MTSLAADRTLERLSHTAERARRARHSSNFPIARRSVFPQYRAPMSSSRRQYPFHLIEPKWQQTWDAHETFRAWNPGEQIPACHPFAQRHPNLTAEQVQKFYILD